MRPLARRIRVGAGLGLLAGTIFVAVTMARSAGPEAARDVGAPSAPAEALPPSGPLAADPAAPPDLAPVVPVVRPLEPVARAPKALSEAVRAPEAAQPAAPPSAQTAHWALPAGQVDPALAAVEGDRLVQVLEDGTRLELTLDPLLQRVAKRSLERFRVDYGAVVAIRPQTGEILAMAEHAEHRPDLRHLSLQSEGPAASIFKIVSAAALVEMGKLSHQSRICTHGGHRRLTLYNLEDKAERDTQCETLAEALGSSNNVAFARWADRLLQPGQLQEMAERFLFNKRLPFLWGVGVSAAKIPTGSRLGFAQSAAGFVGTTLSPLHGALIAATIANGGKMMAPRLVARAQRGDQLLYEARWDALAQVVSPEVAREVVPMMVATTATGTASKYFNKRGKPLVAGLEVAGKTGTLTARDAGPARHYSWFVAFAPAEDPEVAVACLIVNGDVWHTKAPVPAREVISAWFEAKKTTGKAAAPGADEAATEEDEAGD